MLFGTAAWIRPIALAGVLLSLLAPSFEAPARAGESPFGEGRPYFPGLQMFPKWEATLHRFTGEVRCRTQPCRAADWLEIVAALRALGPGDLIRAVNRQMNAVRYVPDKRGWRQSDYWATPAEFLREGGDCEDYAIAKYLTLRALGMPASSVRIAVVWDRTRRMHHAVVLVHDGDRTLVLDSLTASLREWNDVRAYELIYSVNEDGWWLERGLVAARTATPPSVGRVGDATRVQPTWKRAASAANTDMQGTRR